MSDKIYHPYVKDNTILILGNILVYIKSLILIPIIINTTSVTTYGGFALLLTLFGVVYGVSSFGAGFKMQRYLPSVIQNEYKSKLYYNQFFFQMTSILVLSILIILLDRPINKFIFKNEVSFSLLLVPLYLFSEFLSSQVNVYFRFTSRIKIMTFAGILSPYIQLGIILLIYYLYNSMNINGLVLSQIIASSIIAIPLFGVIVKELGFKFSFYKFSELKDDIKMGFPLVFNYIFDFILAGSDRYIIAFYLTVTDVGFYIPGYVLGSLMIFIPKAMGGAIPQLLSKSIDNNDENSAHMIIKYSIKFFLLIAIPFIMGCVFFSKSLLALIGNAEIAQKAYFITLIVSLSTLFQGINIILSNILFVRLKTDSILKMNLLASLFNLVANIVLLYYFKNIIVAALSTLISYFITFLFVKFTVSKIWLVDFQPVVIFKSVFSSLIMGSFLYIIYLSFGISNNVITILSEVSIGIIIYFVLLYFTNTFSEKEINFMKKLAWK